MTWDDLLAEFRALGGIADNLSLREGSRGRGLFPADPSRPVRLRVPDNLLIPVSATTLRDGQMVVVPGDVPEGGPEGGVIGARERAFFAAYQRHFGWGSAAREAIWRDQTEWAQLPAAVKEQMQAAGVPEARFLPPSEPSCLHLFLKNRIIHYRGIRVVMPIMELVNHAGSESRYQSTDGVSVIEKTFPGEMLVSYGNGDAWGCATEFGFADNAAQGLSLACIVGADTVRISIGRDLNSADNGGFPIPPVARTEAGISIPFLVLGNRNNPDAPSNDFRVMMESQGIANGNRIFNLIHRYNTGHYIELLRRLDGAPGRVAAMLRVATLHQMEALSAH